MKQISDKSIYLWVLKWLSVIGTALIASHYAMLPFGYKSFIIDYITDVSLFAGSIYISPASCSSAGSTVNAISVNACQRCGRTFVSETPLTLTVA